MRSTSFSRAYKMALEKGCIARACGLQRRPELNGTLGLVIDEGNFCDNQRRLTMLTIPQRELLALRPLNMQLASDSYITVCMNCKQDFWSWATHSSYAGWQRVGKKTYICPSCSPSSSGAWASVAQNKAYAHCSAGGVAWACLLYTSPSPRD